MDVYATAHAQRHMRKDTCNRVRRYIAEASFSTLVCVVEASVLARTRGGHSYLQPPVINTSLITVLDIHGYCCSFIFVATWALDVQCAVSPHPWQRASAPRPRTLGTSKLPHASANLSSVL